MSRSIVIYLEEQKCGKVGSGSREGLMRDELGSGLGPRDGRGSKKGRKYRGRIKQEQEIKNV